MMEQFEQVPWAPEYEVSNLGRARKAVNRGFDRPCRNRRKWRYLGWAHPNGYRLVCIGGQNWFIHRLVYRIFVGQLIEGLHIAHLDGDPQNNVVRNLDQVTPAENSSHKRLHGTQCAGETHGGAQHTQEQADAVRAALAEAEYYPRSGRLKEGERQRIIEELGVGLGLVQRIRSHPDAWRAS